MGAVSYYTFSSAITEKSVSFYRVSLLETDRKLGYALGEITAVTNAAITQPVVQQALKQGARPMSYDRRQEINHLLVQHPMVRGFGLYGQDGTLLYGYNMPAAADAPERASWYAAMEAAGGRPVWSGPGENGVAAGTDVLIHARLIKDFDSLANIGVLVMHVKPDLLDQVFWDSATLQQGDILLVNASGDVVFAKSGHHVGERLALPAAPANGRAAGSYETADYYGESSLMTYLPSQQPGWMLAAITPSALLRAELEPIRNTAAALLLFALLSAVLFDRLFIARLVGVISSAVSGMKRVQRRVFEPLPVPRRAEDETDLLIEGFNRMGAQIGGLLERVEAEQRLKKEAELQALLAQINPHFIYNSLEAINSMAVLQGNRDISRMVVSLGKLLRISISGKAELIPLEAEFEHVRHYLHIQKYRFEDSFDWELALPAELGGYPVPKLIVQPLVENALHHAVDPARGKGAVRVEAFADSGRICIEVRDNGPGFDPDALARLAAGESAPPAPRGGGVGLRNVHERLRIRYGGGSGLMICSETGGGSRIRMTLPQLPVAAAREGGDEA
ncbi:sensor histidine kinase [Paenibacillus sabuli]|nr:sensor histidine kinase [Paenibacillus sabuli]